MFVGSLCLFAVFSFILYVVFPHQTEIPSYFEDPVLETFFKNVSKLNQLLISDKSNLVIE